MYTLNEYLPIFVGEDLPAKGWNDGMYCLETNAVNILRTNLTQGFVSCFAFTLVDKGWMSILYNGRELTLNPNDLYTYSPCLPVTVIATSDDFHGYCLLTDEHITIKTPYVHDLVQLAYLPIVQLHEPKQTLPSDAAQHLIMKMREIIGYLHSNHIYKSEVLHMLYSIFILDLQNAQNHAIVHRQTPSVLRKSSSASSVCCHAILLSTTTSRSTPPCFISAPFIFPAWFVKSLGAPLSIISTRCFSWKRLSYCKPPN